MKQGLVSITHSAYGVGMRGSGAMHVGCDVMKCGLGSYDQSRVLPVLTRLNSLYANPQVIVT